MTSQHTTSLRGSGVFLIFSCNNITQNDHTKEVLTVTANQQLSNHDLDPHSTHVCGFFITNPSLPLDL